MSSRDELLAQAAQQAGAELQRSYAASREEAARREAAQRVTPAVNARHALEDSAAAAIAAQYGIPCEDVEVNGRRYGDLLASRHR